MGSGGANCKVTKSGGMENRDRRKTTVIFDMDGVLVDTEPLYYTSFKEALARFGYEFPDTVLLPLTGWGLEEKFAFLRREYGLRESVEEFSRCYRDRKGLPESYGGLLNPGVKETLTGLKNFGCALAVASNGKLAHVERVLEDCRIRSFFACAVSGADLGRRKPDPGVYLETMRRLGAYADACVAVEDSTYGIRAAVAAGVDVIAKRDGRFPFSQEKARVQIDRLDEVPGVIRSWNRT